MKGLLVVLLFFTGVVMAEPFKGISTFAAMAGKRRFPGEKVLTCYPKSIKKPAIAVLYGYFGRDWSFIRAFCELYQDRKHLVEIHLAFRDEPRNIIRRARVVTKRMQQIANRNTRILICPILEDNIPDQEYVRIARRVRKATPYRLVRSGLYGRYVGGDFEELHGRTLGWHRKKSRRIYNSDGTSIILDGDQYYSQMTIAQFKKISAPAGYARYIWYAPLQGLQNARKGERRAADEREFILTDRARAGMKELLNGR